jgi:hypothetical protein
VTGRGGGHADVQWGGIHQAGADRELITPGWHRWIWAGFGPRLMEQGRGGVQIDGLMVWAAGLLGHGLDQNWATGYWSVRCRLEQIWSVGAG